VGFALTMLQHFCRIWEAGGLRSEGLRRRSHAEPQRLICSGGLRVDDATAFLSDLGEVGGLPSEGLKGRSHAERQVLMCCAGLRIEDA